MEALNITFVCSYIINGIAPCAVANIKGSTNLDLKSVRVNDSFAFSNLFDFIVCTLGAPLMIFLAYRCLRKSAAVGFREMATFYFLISLTLLTQIFVSGADGFNFDNSTKQAFAITNMALATATFFVLMFNGFVGFQIWRDGGIANMSLMIGGALATMAITLLLCINRVTEFSDGFGRDDFSLMIVYVGFPALCILSYAIFQSVLIVRTLGLFTPLLYVGFAALSVSVYSIVALALNDKVLQSTKMNVDGGSIGNLSLVIGTLLVYGYWSSITQGGDSGKK